MNRQVWVVSCALLAGAVPVAGQGSKSLAQVAEKALETYLVRFLPFDLGTRVTVAKTAEKSVAGFQAYKVHRTGRYAKLNVDRVVLVSNDGRWFFDGDTLPNKEPRPVRSNADLEWLSAYLTNLFRTSARAILTPERDAGGLKGVVISAETGYGQVRLPGYVTPDGRVFLQGSLWDFRQDPRKERQRWIDLSAGRAEGPASARVTVAEYADMECGYCKFRGRQMDRLLKANAGVVSVRRHYKFFPLWLAHVWSMKAASAADCIFRFAGAPAMFRFKSQVYARQDAMTVSGIDELAVQTAEAEGITSSDFLSCYLREESFGRVLKDMEEGYRLGVNSTPTYFVDGTEITWIEDKVMEDFLRTLFPKVKTIDYTPQK